MKKKVPKARYVCIVFLANEWGVAEEDYEAGRWRDFEAITAFCDCMERPPIGCAAMSARLSVAFTGLMRSQLRLRGKKRRVLIEAMASGASRARQDDDEEKGANAYSGACTTLNFAESSPRNARIRRLLSLSPREDRREEAEEAKPLPLQYPSHLGALTGREKVTLYCDDLLKGCKVGLRVKRRASFSSAARPFHHLACAYFCASQGVVVWRSGLFSVPHPSLRHIHPDVHTMDFWNWIF